MTDFAYGPVELILIGFDDTRPKDHLVTALTDLIESETLTLIDLVFVSRAADGSVELTEIEDASEEYGFGGVELEATGLASSEDLDALVEQVPPGSSAAVLVVEHSWARRLASALADADGVVLQTERIPAPAVNELLAHLRD